MPVKALITDNGIGSSLLHEPCLPTHGRFKVTADVLKDLWDTFYTLGKHCAGLAAPQISYPIRVCVVKEGHVELINPVIAAKRGYYPSVEGCYSIPGYEAIIPRATEIRVFYEDTMGNHKLLISDNLPQAIAIQHEMDHLDGILISDYVQNKKNKKGGILVTEYDRQNPTVTAYLGQVLELGTFRQENAIKEA